MRHGGRRTAAASSVACDRGFHWATDSELVGFNQVRPAGPTLAVSCATADHESDGADTRSCVPWTADCLSAMSGRDGRRVGLVVRPDEGVEVDDDIVQYDVIGESAGSSAHRIATSSDSVPGRHETLSSICWPGGWCSDALGVAAGRRTTGLGVGSGGYVAGGASTRLRGAGLQRVLRRAAPWQGGWLVKVGGAPSGLGRAGSPPGACRDRVSRLGPSASGRPGLEAACGGLVQGRGVGVDLARPSVGSSVPDPEDHHATSHLALGADAAMFQALGRYAPTQGAGA